MEDGRWGKKALNHPGAVWSEQDDPAHILYRVVVFSFSVSDHIMLSFCLNLSAEGKFFLVNIGRMSTHSQLKAFQMRHLADQSVLHASLTGQVKIFCQNKRADPFVWFEKVRLAPGGRTQRWIPPLPSTCAQCMSQQIIHASKDSILDQMCWLKLFCRRSGLQQMNPEVGFLYTLSDRSRQMFDASLWHVVETFTSPGWNYILMVLMCDPNTRRSGGRRGQEQEVSFK